MKTGMSYKVEKIVEEKDSAKAMGSGNLDVFGTPALIALMENCAFNCVEESMVEGNSTVGISINMKHLKANKIGDSVFCVATLEEIDGKKLKFEIEASCVCEVIGIATHERFIVDVEKFMGRL